MLRGSTLRLFSSQVTNRVGIRSCSYFVPPLKDANIDGLNYLKLSKTASQIYYLEPNNPPVNALRSEMLSDFEKVANEFEKSPPRCIVIRCDVAGANIVEMQAQSPKESEDYANRAKAAFRKLRSTGAPIIGFTTKFAIGGGLELLMHSDIRYSGPKAIIQAPEVELDTYQSFGGTYLLPRYLTSGLALRAQLKSENIDPKLAVQHGLLTEVVEDPNPNATIAKAFEDAIVIARKKPSVVRKNVQMVRLSETPGENLEDVCAKESKGFGETFEGGALGMRRFLEKYRLEEWGPNDKTVIHGEFKALGIDTTQINSFIDIVKYVEEKDNVKALFLCGNVSGGDIKKLYKALTNTPSHFSEFLEKEYLWHEMMRSGTTKPLFYFGGSILGGGGLGVFNSTKYKICSPSTVFMMPEIELGACPDVAGTYDLARLGSVGRGMAIAALDLNGSEAKSYGIANYLVDPKQMNALKESLLDAIVNDENVENVLNEYSTSPEEPRNSQEEYDNLFGESLSLFDVIEKVKSGNSSGNSLAQRAYSKMENASSYGIVLSDIMNKEGKNLELRSARALEYAVWTNMDQTDFKESIYSRFILPKKERKKPSFTHPNIFEISKDELQELQSEIQSMVNTLKEKLSDTENLLFQQE